MKLIEWPQFNDKEDMEDNFHLNAYYVEHLGEMVSVYLDHEDYKAYIHGDIDAGYDVGKFFCEMGYEPVLRGA